MDWEHSASVLKTLIRPTPTPFTNTQLLIRVGFNFDEFQYRVKFRIYNESDDVWLPASSFDRPGDFVSRSRYDRKRFHKSNVDEASADPLLGVLKVETGDSVEKYPKRKCVKGPQDHPM